MCLPARESVDQVECLPASATWWLSPNRSFFDLARTMKSGQNQQLVPWTVNRKHYNNNKKQSGEACFAKVEPAKCVIVLGINFENSLREALILDKTELDGHTVWSFIRFRQYMLHLLCVGFGLVWVCFGFDLVLFGFALGFVWFGLGLLWV